MAAGSEGAACDGQKEDGGSELLGAAGDEEGVQGTRGGAGYGGERTLPGDGAGLRRLPGGEGVQAAPAPRRVEVPGQVWERGGAVRVSLRGEVTNPGVRSGTG